MTRCVETDIVGLHRVVDYLHEEEYYGVHTTGR